ncbi:MAG: hypothetical protein MZV70_62465 [Desulfobacterales bacterium]|nr:hypothetical protein [Desulfobacterales bacterium]
MIQKIGASGDLISKARESLVSFQRLLMYVQQATNVTLSQDQRGRFKSTLRDVQSLSDHATLPRQQGAVPARRGARAHQPRAEQHHQDLLGGRGDVPAADADRQHLRHELPLHAGAGQALGLPAGAGGDGRSPRSSRTSTSAAQGWL